MTFNPASTIQDLAWLAEIEPARRLEGATWTQAAGPNTNCYYIAHPEGEPSRIRECLKSTGVIVTYTEKNTLAECNAIASLLTNGDFATNDLTGWTAAAGWSAATGKAVHNGTIADTTALIQGITLTSGGMYEVSVTTSGTTAGTLTMTFGTLTGSYAVGAAGTTKQVFTATSTASFNLTFTPSATFDGAVDDITVTLIGAWWWDATNSLLYVRTSTAANPGLPGTLFLINSYFWERIADRTIDLDGHPYRPLLDPSSIADLSFEATQFSDGGISQSFGSVTALNPGGYWDTRLAGYVYEGKRILVKFGVYGDAYASYIKLFDGYTGGTTWTDAAVVFDTEDPRRFQE